MTAVDFDAILDALEADLTPVEREIGSITIYDYSNSWHKPRRLKPVGFWWTGTNSLLPHPTDLVDRAWNVKERRAVVRYLQSGRVKMRFMGFAHCRCKCKELVPGSADLTDEIWVWPEGLVHYVEEHGVRLPAEFVQYVMERS